MPEESVDIAAVASGCVAGAENGNQTILSKLEHQPYDVPPCHTKVRRQKIIRWPCLAVLSSEATQLSIEKFSGDGNF